MAEPMSEDEENDKISLPFKTSKASKKRNAILGKRKREHNQNHVEDCNDKLKHFHENNIREQQHDVGIKEPSKKKQKTGTRSKEATLSNKKSKTAVLYHVDETKQKELTPITFKVAKSLGKKPLVLELLKRKFELRGNESQLSLLVHVVIELNQIGHAYEQEQLIKLQHSRYTSGCNDGKFDLKAQKIHNTGKCRLRFIEKHVFRNSVYYTQHECSRKAIRLAHMHSQDHIFCYVPACGKCNGQTGNTQVAKVSDAYWFKDLSYNKPAKDKQCCCNYLGEQTVELGPLAEDKDRDAHTLDPKS